MANGWAEATVHDPGGLTCISFSFPIDAFIATSISLFGDAPPAPRTDSVTLRLAPSQADEIKRLLLLGLDLPQGPTTQVAAELLRATLTHL